MWLGYIGFYLDINPVSCQSDLGYRPEDHREL